MAAALSCAPLPALADEALACDDKCIIAKRNSGYANPDNIAKTRIETPRELAYGLPPAPARVAFEKTHYCKPMSRSATAKRTRSTSA